MDAVVDSRTRRPPCRLEPTLRGRRMGSMSTMVTMNMIWVCFLVWVGMVAAAPVSSIIAGEAEVVILDLVPSSCFGGQVEVFLGPDHSRQRVRLLPTFKKSSAPMVQVPGAELCSALPNPDTWNEIRKPKEGDMVPVNAQMTGVASMMETVKWTPSAGEGKDMVGLMLRKGRGDAPANVTLIEAAIRNTGEYLWDASRTFRDAKLSDDTDYSLMIFTNSSTPRTSSSGYFSLKTVTLSSTVPVTINIATGSTPRNTNPDIRSECLDFLLSNGGFYNQSSDLAFKKSDFTQGSLDNINLGREGTSSSSGYTQLTFDATDRQNDLKVSNGGVDTILTSNLGAGTLALNSLQHARHSQSPELDIISLYTGTEEHPGSIVLGGYDRSLIDTAHSATFQKGVEHPDIVVVPLQSVAVLDGDKKSTILPQKGPFNIALSWDSFGLRLPEEMIKALLPNIGNPTYDGSVGGYVYSNSTTPRLDYSIVFTFNNGAKDMVVSIPASSLLMTETVDDNPVTPLKESGRQYLAISRTTDGSTAGAYLGRRFLRHVYFVDSPPSIKKFHMNAIPEKIPTKKDIVPASTEALALFSGVLPKKETTISNKTGRLVAGLSGAIAVIVVLLFVFWLYRRGTRTKRRPRNRDTHRRRSTDTVNSFSKEIGGAIPDRKKPRKSRRVPGTRRASSRRQTTHSIPIRYHPSDKELGQTVSKELDSSGGKAQRTKWSPFSSPVKKETGDNKTPQHGIFPTPTEENRESFISAMKRRKSEVSTVAREYFSRPTSVVVEDPHLNAVRARHPTLSPVETRLRHMSSCAQVYSADDDGLSVFFETRGLSPPPTPRAFPRERASSPTEPNYPSENKGPEGVAEPASEETKNAPNEPPPMGSSQNVSKDVGTESKEASRPNTTSPISPGYSGRTPTPDSSERSNTYGPPEEPTIFRTNSAVSSTSRVSRPSMLSSVSRISVVSRISPVQRVLSMNKRLPRIPSPTLYSCHSPSPPDSPILPPGLLDPGHAPASGSSSLIIQRLEPARTIGDEDESVFGLPAVMRDDEYLQQMTTRDGGTSRGDK